eukprot:16252-Eustigmatos_ZCMA.PRE.1
MMGDKRGSFLSKEAGYSLEDAVANLESPLCVCVMMPPATGIVPRREWRTARRGAARHMKLRAKVRSIGISM